MPTPTVELTHLRDRHRKVFATDEDGVQVARLWTRPVHYTTEAGEFDDLDNLLATTADGFVAKTLGARFGIEGGWLTFTHRGHSLRMRPTAVGMVDRTAPATRWQKLADADYSTVSRNGLSVTVSDIFPQTDLRLGFRDGLLRKEFVIRQRPNLPDPTSLGWDPDKTFLVIVWDVEKPAGAIVRDAVTDEVVGLGYVGNNDLLVQTPGGDTVLTFLAGSATSSWALARPKPVWYVVAPNVPFGEAVTYALASSATYPLTIDPTTTVYPSASADDGHIETSAQEINTDSNLLVGGWEDGKGSSGFYRTFIRFSLSGISGTCTSASLNIYRFQNNGVATDVRKLDADWGTLDWTDYSAASSSIGSISGIGDDIWLGPSLSESAVEASFGGVLPLRLQQPVVYTVTQFYSVDAIGTTNDPYLEVTYTTGGATPALTAKYVSAAT